MAAMPWLRLYTCAATDPKLRLIAAESRHPVAHVLAVWVAMLCHAGSLDGEERGTLAGWLDAAAAAALDLPAATVRDIHGAMAGLLLDSDRIIAWSKRQGARTSGGEGSQGGAPAAVRMRRMRARRSAAAALVTGVTAVTSAVTGHGDAVTAVTDRGEEKREEHPCGSSPGESAGAFAPPPRPMAAELPLPRLDLTPAGAPSPKLAARAAHRLPPEWSPSPDLLAFAAGLRVDGLAAAGAFADYWTAETGAKARKLDWDAAFRTWCRREADPRRSAVAPALRPVAPSFRERDAADKAAGLDMLRRMAMGGLPEEALP